MYSTPVMYDDPVVWPVVHVDWIDPPNDAQYAMTYELWWKRAWGPRPAGIGWQGNTTSTWDAAEPEAEPDELSGPHPVIRDLWSLL